ncbi:hypothetical protein ACOSQ4_000221 [Xanthoceras sorbifolium]
MIYLSLSASILHPFHLLLLKSLIILLFLAVKYILPATAKYKFPQVFKSTTRKNIYTNSSKFLKAQPHTYASIKPRKCINPEYCYIALKIFQIGKLKPTVLIKE